VDFDPAFFLIFPRIDFDLGTKVMHEPVFEIYDFRAQVTRRFGFTLVRVAPVNNQLNLAD
jgi:hypothetical protein